MGRRLPLMAVTWERYVWDLPRPAANHEVESLEREWGVKLPADYKTVAMEHQGMTPIPYVIDVGTGDAVVCELLTLSRDEKRPNHSMSHTYRLIKPLVPAGIYPFAGTGNGDFICFDYRASPESPSVVFYFAELTGEEAVYPIAESFTDFLSRLHD
jgi:cell wall assembly regulator SMI1